MQPGQRIVAGSGNQSVYLAPNGQVMQQGRHVPVPAAVAAEQLERQRQEEAARGHQPTGIRFAASPYAPTRAALGAPTSTVVTTVITVQTQSFEAPPNLQAASSRPRVQLGKR